MKILSNLRTRLRRKNRRDLERLTSGTLTPPKPWPDPPPSIRKSTTGEALVRALKERTPQQRWNQGAKHHSEAVRLLEQMVALDVKPDGLGLGITGPGTDYGEQLLYLMDGFFEENKV